MIQMRSLLIYFPLILFFGLISNVKSLILLENQFELFVHKVASKFHDDWRELFHQQNPTDRNRFKLTTDTHRYNSSYFIYPMILTVGSCFVHRNLKVARNRWNSSLVYVDILNMNYDELPDDWARENRATAQVACQQILFAVKKKRIFDRNLIEQFSKEIHRQWIKRNQFRTNKDLLLAYENLPDIEKEKDQRAILIACQLFNQLRLYSNLHSSPIDIIQ